MIKLIGAIMLVSGTAAWGLLGVIKLRARSAALSSITQALVVMQSEICDRLTPMPELLEILAAESGYPANSLFKRMSERMTALGDARFSIIWRQSVAAAKELMLSQQEESVLAQLGMSLGRYNVEEQRSAIMYTRRRMEEFTKRADYTRDTDSRLRAFLGVASGVFALIILL